MGTYGFGHSAYVLAYHFEIINFQSKILPEGTQRLLQIPELVQGNF